MRCAVCQYENPEDARLCRDCGTSLYTSCSICGTENPNARTYCSNCGAQLHPLTPAGLTIGGTPVIYERDRPAGFWIRLLASIIDSVPLTIITALLAWLLFGENFFDSFVVDDSGQGATGFTGGQGINFILGAAYATAFVSMLGGTLGVLLFRMRILRPDGTMLGPGRAFLRYLTLTVSYLLLGIPIIISACMVAFRQDKRGIHDLICDTVVVIKDQS